MTRATDLHLVMDRASDALGRKHPASSTVTEVLAAWYDAGLTWVHFPVGMGGLDLPRSVQQVADHALRDAGGPEDARALNGIGYGMAAPTLLAHAQTDALRQQWLRPLASTEHIWCQLFSEPGAGSDLAGLATSAVRDGDTWIVTGQKVWSSVAHKARWALLLARTDPAQPKHRGMTYFVLDMTTPGIDVRPLRQMTGQAEFNEVHLDGARIPDRHRLGKVGDGWKVAMTTLMNERSSLGRSGSGRGVGKIADAVGLWVSRPDLHTPVLRDRLAQLWLRAELHRLTGERTRMSSPTGGSPGPEASIGKLAAAELHQEIYEFCMDLLGPESLTYHDYTPRDTFSAGEDRLGPVQQRFLRSRANTIEGGTSDILRNVLGERVLGLPPDLRADANLPWKEIPRG